jgi:hypothetical protein
MIRRLVLILVMLSLVANANAQALPARIGQQIAAVVKNKIGLRGFAANDPRFGATVAAVGTAVVEIGTAVVVAGTAPAWGTVLASAVIAGVVGYGIQALANWLFNKDGTVTVSTGAGSGGPVLPAGKCYTAQGSGCYGSISDAMSALGVTPGTVSGTDQYGAYVWTTYVVFGSVPGYQYFNTKRCRAPSPCSYDFYTGNWPDVSPDDQHAAKFIGMTNGSPSAVQIADSAPPSAPTTKPVAEALAALSDADKAKPLPDQVIADLADAAWRQAANQPAYNGVPYSLTDPVTQADVATARAANPSVPQATVGDLAEPISASNPLGQTAPATSPVTNPAASSPQVNLGDDPGIGFPTLEATPTAQQIIDPLAGLAPSLKSWVVPAHMTECPKPAFDLFNKHIVMDQQCNMLEDNRSTLYNAMLVAWALIALFIILSA